MDSEGSTHFRDRHKEINRDEIDLIVVGSGAAGLTAACTAASLGKHVLVLESSEKVGGTSAISGGMVWIPANTKAAEAGHKDSISAAMEYLKKMVPGASRDARLQAFLERGNEAISFLENHTSLRLQPVSRYPDYYPDLPGATDGGRVLEPVDFDASALGSAFLQLRDPLPEFMLMGGMMVSRKDLPAFRRIVRSPSALWHASKLVTKYLFQRLRAHRGTTLVLGNALMARLFKSALDLGVEIKLDTAATGLITKGGAVVGVRVGYGEKSRNIHASQAVILSTGGISHHHELRKDYVPHGAGTLSATANSGTSNCGAHLAVEIGAALTPIGGSASGFWVPASRFQRSDGTPGVFPHTVTDRAKPGLIAVDQQGRRFVNEAVSYHEFGIAQLSDPANRNPAWLVCDKHFLWTYGLGRIRPFSLSVRREINNGYLKTANTLESLAAQINVPVENFTLTVTQYNAYASDGLDPAFGRGGNSYQRHMGDMDRQPNNCIAPITQSPFYALAVVPADLGMAAGIVTDELARVIDTNGQPIVGLYACGNDMHSVMNGAYPGPGITIGPALVFGYIAAHHATGAHKQSLASA